MFSRFWGGDYMLFFRNIFNLRPYFIGKFLATDEKKSGERFSTLSSQKDVFFTATPKQTLCKKYTSIINFMTLIIAEVSTAGQTKRVFVPVGIFRS